MTYRILILGASYGSLFGTKCLMAVIMTLLWSAAQPQQKSSTRTVPMSIWF